MNIGTLMRPTRQFLAIPLLWLAILPCGASGLPAPTQTPVPEDSRLPQPVPEP